VIIDVKKKKKKKKQIEIPSNHSLTQKRIKPSSSMVCLLKHPNPTPATTEI
jgi:hypothetical protein